MSNKLGPAVAVLVAAAFVLAPSALAEQSLITIDTPSEHVDESTAVFNERPEVLEANVLLPDGYDAEPEREWPVLFLLHGVGDTYASWAEPAKGDITETAKGLPAIIVMPEGGRGFYTNWFNGGKRGDPAWERFYLEELIPQIERDFRVAPGRRNHAIAGLSMGGLGAAFLGGQRPDYFGTVSTFSGFVQHQRPNVEAGLRAAYGLAYEDVFGPLEGPYATGHNPTRLPANLGNTPVFAATGNGVAEPGVESSPAAIAGGGAVEAEIFQENEEFAAALREAGVELDYRPGLGVHDWPYWRRYLKQAIEWGLFRDDVVQSPSRWTYSTIATSGRMWGLRFRFAAPPEAVARFERDGVVLRGEGVGTVTLARQGCSFTADLPFERSLPSVAAGDDCGRLRVRVAPREFRAGERASVRVRVVRAAGGRTFPISGALVRVGRSEARTDDRGRAVLRHRFAGYPGQRSVRVAAPGFERVLVALRVQ
ncbi:MAG: alpha/beta hydrolase family protein [Solirubrobacteraceae bacterium]